MMVLTRKEKEDLVVDLYNEGKTYREIAKEVRICPRDIKTILQKSSNGNESEQMLSKAAQAYDLFSRGKSPMEVAVSLDLREPEVNQLYKESWNLKQIGDLNRIYLETRGNLAHFLTLYKMSKAAGYTAEHVVWLLGLANSLPELEQRYNYLKSEVDWLQVKKQYLLNLIQDYEGQISTLGKTFDDYCRSCEQEREKLADLQAKRMKEKNITRHLENNKAEIKKITEEKVHVLLSNRKAILKLAVLCITESIRGNPENIDF